MRLQSIISVLLSGCFLVVPLAFIPWHFHAFETGKWFIFIASILLATGCVGAICCHRLTAPIPRSRLSLAVSAYLCHAVASYWWFPYTDTKYFLQIFGCGALFFLVSLMTNAPECRRLFFAVGIAASVSSLIGILQFFGLTFIKEFAFSDVNFGLFEGVQVFGTLGNSNLLGGYCASLLPLLAVVIIASWKERRKLRLSAYLVVALHLSLALLFSRTRASWLAVLCSFGALFLIHFKCRKWLLIALCSFLLLGTLVLLRIPDLSDATTLRFRFTYYRGAIAIIKERPFFGRGLGTFNVYYPRYRDHRLAATLGEPTRDYRIEHPHNEHLEQLSDGGLLGYGLFLWMLIEAFIRLLRRRNPLDSAIAASLFGLLVEGCFSQNLRFIAVSSVFWLFLGFANSSALSKQITLPARFPFRNALRIVACLLTILLCACALRFSYRLTRADALLKIGMEQYFGQRFPEAITAFRAAIAHDAQNKQARYYLASAYHAVHDPTQAIAAYQALLQRDPNFLRANFLLADLYLQRNQPDEALIYLRHQIAADSMDWEAYGLAAFIELQADHLDAARGYLQEINAIHAITPITPEVLKQVEALLQQIPAQAESAE